MSGLLIYFAAPLEYVADSEQGLLAFLGGALRAVCFATLPIRAIVCSDDYTCARRATEDKQS